MTEGSHPVFAYIKINAKLDPMTRGDVFEDPLTDLSEAHPNIFEVTGGGTAMSDQGISYCGIDVDLINEQKGIEILTEYLNKTHAPKGSQIEIPGKDPIAVGDGACVVLNLSQNTVDSQFQQGNTLQDACDPIFDAIEGKPIYYGNAEKSEDRLLLHFYCSDPNEFINLVTPLISKSSIFEDCRIERIF